MKKENKISISKEKRGTLVLEIQEYFSKEREEEIGDLGANLLLDFVIDKMAPEFYNLGVLDSYNTMKDMAEDLLSIQK